MSLLSSPKKPHEVLKGKDPGITFITDPDDKIVRKMGLMETMNIIIIVFLIVGVPMIFGPIPFSPINMELYYTILSMAGILLGAFIFFMVMFFFAARSKDKEKTKMTTVSFIKVFKKDLGIYQHSGRFHLMNVIPIENIKGIHFDANGYLKKNGYKYRTKYWPFMTLPPLPQKGGELFYLHVTPMDHLVRIEFNRPTRILNHDPDLKGNWWGMPLYQREYDLNNLIVSIKPEEQDKFRSFVMGK